MDRPVGNMHMESLVKKAYKKLWKAGCLWGIAYDKNPEKTGHMVLVKAGDLLALLHWSKEMLGIQTWSGTKAATDCEVCGLCSNRLVQMRVPAGDGGVVKYVCTACEETLRQQALHELSGHKEQE